MTASPNRVVPPPGPEEPQGHGLPLLEAQEGIWYAQRLDPQNPIYNTGQYVEIVGSFDRAAFRTAVHRALSEADGLRRRIGESDDGTLVQWESPLETPALQEIDLQGEVEARDDALGWMREDMARPLDPARDPLLAETLFVLGPRHHLWYQRIHHLVVDGYGTVLLTSRIVELYRAEIEGKGGGRPFLPLETVVAEDRAYRDSETRRTDRAYWMERFRTPPEVPEAGSGAALTSHRRLREERLLPDLLPGLRALSEESGISWPDLLVGLVAGYLQRFGAKEEVVIGVPTMNRMGSAAARIPCMTMNILPLRVPVEEDRPLVEWLAETGGALRDARRHGRYRSELLRRELGLLGDGRRLFGPLVNVLPFDDPPLFPGAESSLVILGAGAVDDLTITIRGSGRKVPMRLEVEANPALHSPEATAEHADRILRFLERSIRSDTLAEVPTLTESERERWIEEVNDTGHPVAPGTLVSRMEETFRRNPEGIAVVSESGEELSYRELDLRTAALARRLAAAGVGRDRIVAVVLPRSLDRVLAFVAIQRAGGAYLPIDPDHPLARNARVLDSASPAVVLTRTSEAGAVPGGWPLLLIDDAGAAGEGAGAAEEDSSENPAGRNARRAAPPASSSDGLPPPPSPEDAAYLLYTSGSTGEPKGVLVEHRAIVNRLEWMAAAYDFGPEDRFLQKTPATFDVSVWEFFLPLLVGGTLVVAPPGVHRDPGALARLLRRERITTVHFVPSMLALFLSDPESEGMAIRRVFCSGEALTAQLRDRFHARMRGELHNLYGPTEAAVDVTWWETSPEDRSDPVPIGFPVWNTRMYILDDRLRPVPPGVEGDLYIAGVQLAREYLGDPERTRERFLPDPFRAPGERMYATGDRALFRRDGAILFGGRSDDQIKIRGIRTEPGEIEAVIAEWPEVAKAIVRVRTDSAGEPRLVAWVLPVPGGELPPVSDLRSRMADRLPEAMIPTAWVPIAELPLSPSGKLDARALPEPPRIEGEVGALPETEAERGVAALFSELLGVESVGVDADFFTLGGHSLLAARLLLRIREEWGIDPGLGAIFAAPTPARLGALLEELLPEASSGAGERSRLHPATERNAGDRGTPSSDGATPVVERRGRPARPTERGLEPLLPMMEGRVLPPLFCFHPAGGISWCYGGLARAVGPGRPVFGVQAPGLDPDIPLPDSLGELAADYVRRMRTVRNEGPFHLVGWSVGGILAHEVALHLHAAGEEVGVVAMLDSYPAERWRNHPEPEEGASLRALLLIAGMNPDDHAGGHTPEGVIAFLRAKGHPLGELSDRALEGVLRVVEGNNRLVRGHRHRVWTGDLLHFRAAEEHSGTDFSVEEWRPWVAGRIEGHDLPLRHSEMTGPVAVRTVARILEKRMIEATDGRFVPA